MPKNKPSLTQEITANDQGVIYGKVELREMNITNHYIHQSEELINPCLAADKTQFDKNCELKIQDPSFGRFQETLIEKISK